MENFLTPKMQGMLGKMKQIVRAAGAIVLQADEDKQVCEKSSHHDLATRYDTAVQTFLHEQLLQLVPQAGFIGEEDDVPEHLEASWHFIVDPIDGTANFIKDLRHSAVSVALAYEGTVQFGVIYNPYADEMFSAQRGKGAWMNDKPIHVSTCTMERAMAYVGASPYYPQYMDETFQMARLLAQSCIDIRRSGSAALELCDVALGRADVFFESCLSPWDYAAASVLIEEAGGKITDKYGKPLQFLKKSSAIAANAVCFEETLQLYRQVL